MNQIKCISCQRTITAKGRICSNCRRKELLKNFNSFLGGYFSNHSSKPQYIIVDIVLISLILGIFFFNYEKRKPDDSSNKKSDLTHIDFSSKNNNQSLSRDIDIAPLYNEVQKRKREQGITDKEAVNQILREKGETP